MNDHDQSRRHLLKLGAALPVLFMVPLARRGGEARAGTAAKEDFHYQDHPNEGKRCAGCVAFNPPPQGQAFGTCNIVAGPVSPDGWCMAFTSK